jgi:hypothetical protein
MMLLAYRFLSLNGPAIRQGHFKMKFPDVTPRTVRAIERLMDSLPAKMKRERWLPIICWEIDSGEPGSVPGPCIGLDKETIIPSDFVVQAFGMKIAFNLPEEILERHNDYVLDYVGGRFMFVKRSMTTFLGSEATD